MDDKNDDSQVLPSSLTSAPQSLIIYDNHVEIDVPGEVLLRVKQEAEATPLCGQFTVEKEQPSAQLYHLLPSSSETCTGYKATPSATSLSKTQDSLKHPKVNVAPDGDDFCAAILLACLFCHPLDCLWASVRGCGHCCWSLCSSLCCCDPGSLPSVPDINRLCDLCSCLGLRCCLCDCPMCDICLQATECLDLAMEISQMLYH